MAQLESGIPSSQRQGPLPLPQQSLGLEARDLQQPDATEGKEATIHDFLSLCGSGNTSSTVSVTKNGLQSSVTTQDLLQPLQKSMKPGSSNLLPHAFVLSGTKPHTSSGDYGTGQQNTYALVNGTLELPSNLQSKYRSSNINYVAKAHVAHGIPINKHWQQQQVGLEILDGNKRPARVPSEDDDDEDDESLDHGYNPKKESHYQKCDTTQLEGKSMDRKGITPRSKHSATEQRRRSKINDRFQMLRQLLPNADQKRDKASFLLEVIEYIQMLHEKVKKYEAAEHGGQQQERAKSISWDRNFGHRDAVANSSYIPLLSTATHDTKEAPDSNGYMRSRTSPLRITCENGINGSELLSSMVQVSSMLGPPACLSNYESKSLVSKPTLLTFTQPPAISTLERASSTMFQTVSQLMPEGRTMFGHLLRQEEQAAIKAKCSMYNIVEAIALPQLQQTSNLLTPETLNYVLDQDHEKLRSPECNPAISNHRRPDEELEERTRSSQVIDMFQTDIGSAVKESGKDDGRPAHGLDGKDDGMPVYGVINGPKGEVPAKEQERPAVLGGVINISSVYSQGLLDTLTQALQSSGIDLLGRRICSGCGNNFNLADIDVKGTDGSARVLMPAMLPPPACLSKLMVREDDTEEVVRERLRIYAQESKPVEDYYRRQGKLLDFDVAGGIPQTWPRLLAALKLDTESDSKTKNP